MNSNKVLTSKGQSSLLVISDKIISVIDLIGATVVVVTITVIFFGLLGNVVLRYTLGDGISWAYELPLILFPWMIAGGVIMTAARVRDISVRVLIDLLPNKLHRFLMVLTHISVAIISISVMVTGERILMASKFQKLPETGLTQVWGYSSIYFAFSFVAILSIIHVITILFTNKDIRNSSEDTSFS